MKNKGLVTIITPFFNSLKFFHETYNSVISQTYTNFEWIVVDNGSSEDVILQLKHILSNDERIKLIKVGYNCGAGLARNHALEQSNGEFLTFIDSDDLWDPDFLSTMIDLLLKSSVDLIYGGYRRIYEDGRVVQFLPSVINNHSNILRGCDISCLATMFRNSDDNLHARFGSLTARNDLVFFYSLLKSVDAYPVPIVKSTYRITDGSLSRNKLRALKFQWIVNRNYAKKNLGISLINCIFWIMHGFIKYKE
jgi:glycosyltransferase involved in cell wall biosynthesis